MMFMNTFKILFRVNYNVIGYVIQLMNTPRAIFTVIKCKRLITFFLVFADFSKVSLQFNYTLST